MRSVDLRIQGRVQGVFYRASTTREADRLGVRGWVRNEPDGSVAAHLEGEPDAVAELISWCGHGPPGARVERVDVEDSAPTGAAGFTTLGG
ncbi:acylphosphatase [Nocardioides sp. GXZ039]|uniref:acylphosphatase n=1 Tax=Nocardioides sp. GXZ039 TaxID=3136018 RepID=UPI0030F39B5D